MPPIRAFVWGVPALIYVLFWLWYTPLGGPMKAAEVDALIADMTEAGASEAQLKRMRTFFGEDDGKQFVMVNIIDMSETPETLPATGPDADASALLGHYMEYMYPALFARASHPVFAGNAVNESMDLVGIENAEVWDRGALMRYRSRRDLYEISSNPVFNDRHDYKVAALDKTIAFPVAPVLFLSDPRLLLFFVFLSIAGLVDALLRWRQTRSS
ncbi:MAG: hypothetical protein AAFY82_06700 [Pseudomonadota bacterium]